MSNITLRSDILKEALRTLSAENVEDLSLRKLAKKVGVTHQAPYHYFKSKDELIWELQNEAFNQVIQIWESEIFSERNPFKRLAKMGTSYFNFCTDHPGYFKALSYRLSPGDRAGESVKKCFKLLEHAVNLCFEAKKDKSSDPKALCYLCWSSIHGLAALYYQGALLPSNAEKKEKAQMIAKRMTAWLSELMQASK